jgi:hypothetical protein
MGIGNIETWYYDAIFDNGYSIVTLINFVRTIVFGVAITSLYIYKDGKLISSIRNQNSSKHFNGSEDKPLLSLKGIDILKGEIEHSSNNWLFHLLLGDEEIGIDLELLKDSKAWTGKTYLGRWIVIPKFKVTGSIFLNGKKINGKGDGYHDHNIYPIYAPFITRGYVFGKIRAGIVDITWARVSKSKNNHETIVVINKDDSYLSIPPENIDFRVEDYTKDQRKIVPTIYGLKVNHDKINLDVKIKSIDFHHLSIPTVNYWRHHVRNIGSIKINNLSKNIDHLEIAEQLIFL